MWNSHIIFLSSAYGYHARRIMRNIRVSRIADRVSQSSKFSKGIGNGIESVSIGTVEPKCRVESNDLNANTFNINPYLLERVIRGGLEDYIVAQSSIARNSFENLVDRRKTTIDGKPSAIYSSILPCYAYIYAWMKGYWKRFRFKIYR